MSNKIIKSIPNAIIVILLIATMALRFVFDKECISSNGNIFHLLYLFAMSVILFTYIFFYKPIKKGSLTNILYVLLMSILLMVCIYFGVVELIKIKLPYLVAFLLVALVGFYIKRKSYGV